MKIIGLIPARGGSKRISGKNMRLLGGKPLLQWAIEGAIKSQRFDEIVVSTDWDACKELVFDLQQPTTTGPMTLNWLDRPPELCADASHDFEWVNHALDAFPGFDLFVILRPTSPFRTAETINRAVAQFLSEPYADSMRAVEKTTAHPKKSWAMGESGLMYPYEDVTIGGFPSYDLSTQSLGDVYCQNGCIHVAWTATLEKFGNVSGERIKPFFTEGREGVDINNPEDLEYAEWLIGRKA